MNYRGDFLINHKDKIQGKTVLECAAGAGYISENIIELEPTKFYMSDYSYNSFTFKWNPYINEPNVVVPIIDILHDLPEFYKNNTVDTVICGGYLYHTCHPAWAIEQMLLGRPRYFYLETSCGNRIEETIIPPGGIEELDAPGNHSSYPGAMSYSFSLPDFVIEKMIDTLNYKMIDKFDRSSMYWNSTPDFEKYPLTESGFQYYNFWSNTTGWWFERND
jgi:hypothetical protein